MKNGNYHEPVLVHEVLEGFNLTAPLKKKVQIIDATLGTGGHTLAMLEAGSLVLGIEADKDMLEIAERRLRRACLPAEVSVKAGYKSLIIVQGNFRNLDIIASENGIKEVDGVLYDLGVSNLQLTSESRGFSFSNPQAKLDMRIDPVSQGITGAILLNGLRKDQLIKLFTKLLDLSSSKWLAKRVLEKRNEKPIDTVGDMLEICKGLRSKPSLHQATLPFLTVRMAVNSELENLQDSLPKAFKLVKTGGVIQVITFHSCEEKIVLDFFKGMERKSLANVSGPIIPSRQEVIENPRSRGSELFLLFKLKNK